MPPPTTAFLRSDLSRQVYSGYREIVDIWSYSDQIVKMSTKESKKTHFFISLITVEQQSNSIANVVHLFYQIQKKSLVYFYLLEYVVYYLNPD